MVVACSEVPAGDGARILRRCIETEADTLRATFAVYLHRAWPMSHADAWEQAHEVLAEVVTIALAKADTFDPARSPRAWLLGIGSKVILRHRAAQVTQRHWELPLRSGAPDDAERPGALFDYLATLAGPDLGTAVEESEAVTVLLARVAPAARQILGLAIIVGLRGERLAEVLHCTPGTARVRLHRAIEQLRAAWNPPGDSPPEGSPS